MRDLPAFEETNDVTSLDINFEPTQSFFVAFRKPANQAKSGGANFAELKTIVDVDGSWQVQFDPAWGGQLRFSSTAFKTGPLVPKLVSSTTPAPPSTKYQSSLPLCRGRAWFISTLELSITSQQSL